MSRSEEIASIIDTLHRKFHFEVKEPYIEENQYIVFTREDEGNRHEVVLENHTDDDGVKDWLIHSSIRDSMTDWFGQTQDEPWPLTRKEMQLFEKLMDAITNNDISNEILDEIIKEHPEDAWFWNVMKRS